MEDELHYGEVVWMDPKKGYGFISWSIGEEKQKDMFLHFSDLVMDGFKVVYKGQKVSFKIGTNLRGQPKAISVTILHN